MPSLNELNRTQHLEETVWRQKARSLWLIQGNHNSKFSYQVANTSYHFNLIHSLHFQEDILTTHVDISNAFAIFYSQIFVAPQKFWDIVKPDILYLFGNNADL